VISTIQVKRFHSYGMTTLQMRGPDTDIDLKLVSRLSKRERRAIVRSFLSQIRPWIGHFSTAAIDHSDDGNVRNRQAICRGVRATKARPLSTISGAFGFEVRMKRLELGTTQAALAESLGIRRSHLSDIERGIYLPNPRTRSEIERVLQIGVSGFSRQTSGT